MKARGKSVIFPQETLSNPLPIIQFSLTVETVETVDPLSVCSQTPSASPRIHHQASWLGLSSDWQAPEL